MASLGSFYLFGQSHQTPSNPYYQNLYLILSHPKFKSKVNHFLDMLASFTNEEIIKMGTLIYALLLPDLPRTSHRKLASELLQALQLQLTPSSPTYNNLGEFLLRICADSIENIDLRSSLAFLETVKLRISDLLIVDAINPQDCQKIDFNVKLKVYDGEQVIQQSDIAEKNYSEELKKVFYSQFLIENLPQIIPPHKCIVRKLKKHEQIIPFGYFYEEFIHDLINTNFEVKNLYRLKGNKRVIVGKVEYWVEVSNMNILRDRVVNQDIFSTGFVMGSEILEKASGLGKQYHMYRVNSAFDRSNYYQKAKQILSGQFNYFNILSEFYDRNEFNIDELSLTTQKLKDRRKEHFLGIVGKETIKKQAKDVEQEIRIYSVRIGQSLNKYSNQSRLQGSIKSLFSALKQSLEEDHNVNVLLQKFLPKIEALPKQNQNPFVEDVIQLASINPMQILIIGRPKCGKSSLAKAVSLKYNLIYISVEKVVQKIFERVKFFQENPPQTDEDGNVKDGLSPLQKCIIEDITQAKAVSDQDLLDLINAELQSTQASTKGFILDLPIQYNKFWTQCIISNRLYTPKISCRFFSHILQIDQTEEQWKYFIQGIMENPDDLTLTSWYDRYLITKPKPPPEQGEDEAQAEEGQKPVALNTNSLIQIKWKESTSAILDHLTQHIHPSNFLKVKNSYQNVEECLKQLQGTLYKIPIAKRIQGAQKQLLVVGLQDTKLVRKWSAWGIVDSVQLLKHKVIMGKFQFAAQYAGRVFVFQNEGNLNKFLEKPRMYLSKRPELPKMTNICITGPRKSGKKTVAKILGEIYQLQIINFEEILQKVLQRQRSFENHVPSNPDKRSNSVHLSEGEWKEFTKGGLLSAKDILPIILYELKIALQKKPQGWGVEKTEEEGGQKEEVIEPQKPVPKKTKKKQPKGNEDQRPRTPPLDDLTLKEIIPQINHFGKLNQTKGYIMIGYPNNEQQLNSLRSFNIPIDKLIVLGESSEEGAAKILSQRLNDAELQQVSLFTTAIAPLKQSLGEQVYKEIMIDKSPSQMINKIRQLIDPFYLKCDEDSLNKVLADKQEDGDPIPMGKSHDYCPVTLKNGWLIKGKEEFEAGVEGKRYKFFGEREMGEFKQNPQQFLEKRSTIPPRIMLMGIRGVGLKTQLLKLNHKFKIPILNLKDTLLQQVDNQKAKRKSERYYNKGFKIPQFDEQMKVIEDPEVNEESPDFDKRKNDIEIMKSVFNGIEEILINGNFYEVEEDKLSGSIVQLLAEARKLPQVVLMLTSDEGKWLERALNRKSIEQQLQQLKRKKKEEKGKQRQEARTKAMQAGQQYQDPPEEEEDPQIPKLEDLILQKQEGLKSQRQADMSKLQQLSQAFKALNVEVIQVKCEREEKHVTDRINNLLKPYLEDRGTKMDGKSIVPIERHRVSEFLNNYIALESRFGKLSPLNLMKPVKAYPMIYEDRVYYLNDEEQLQKVIRNPKILQTNNSLPLDLKIVPIFSIIGRTKTGKTSLAQLLNQKFGFIIISIKQIIDSFINQHFDSDITAILADIKAGKSLTDENIILLVEKRVSLPDCQNKGWVLDGMPQNIKQCQLLNKKGLTPFTVFSLELSELQIKKKVILANQNTYDWDIEVVNERISKNTENLTEVKVYYTNKYNNLKELSGNQSKWGLYESAKPSIESTIKSRRELVRSLCTKSPASASKIGLSYNCIIANLSDYGNCCPTSYKIRRQYVHKCPRHHEFLALYEKKIYLLSSENELKDFLNTPENYTNKGKHFNPPTRLSLTKIEESVNKAQNKGYCMVELTRKKLQKGNPGFSINYMNKIYHISTAQNMKLFIKNPTLFEMATLQDKLPVQFQKKNDLKRIAKKNDCTAFLEHHLSNILMKSLAQLGYRRPKYPTLSSKESALKFLALSLKAHNPNKDDEYRQKYTQKLKKFIKQCNYSQQIRIQLLKKQKEQWQQFDQQNLVKLCEQFNIFLNQLNHTEKLKYFSEFIK